MNTHSFSKYALTLRLGCSRFGWSSLIILAIFCLGSACWFWWIPTLSSSNRQQSVWIKEQHLALSSSSTASKAPSLSQSQKRLSDFYSVMGDSRRTDAHLRILFEMAQASGITLSKGEYKSEYDPVSKIHNYQIQLPVTGSYGAILNFCEKVLLALPFASLDELNVKRDRIGSQLLNVQLRFTMFLYAPPAAQTHRVVVAMEGNIP